MHADDDSADARPAGPGPPPAAAAEWLGSLARFGRVYGIIILPYYSRLTGRLLYILSQGRASGPGPSHWHASLAVRCTVVRSRRDESR
jgi:hypothetical protein